MCWRRTNTCTHVHTHTIAMVKASQTPIGPLSVTTMSLAAPACLWHLSVYVFNDVNYWTSRDNTFWFYSPLIYSSLVILWYNTAGIWRYSLKAAAEQLYRLWNTNMQSGRNLCVRIYIHIHLHFTLAGPAGAKGLWLSRIDYGCQYNSQPCPRQYSTNRKPPQRIYLSLLHSWQS